MESFMYKKVIIIKIKEEKEKSEDEDDKDSLNNSGNMINAH